MLASNKIVVFFTVLFLLWSAHVMAVDTNVATSTLTLGVPEVSLLRTSSGIITLTLSQRGAGESIDLYKSDSTARILISSVITSATRMLSAKITAGTVPSGAQLQLVAKSPNASFVGTSGTLGSPVTLDATDRNIITGIGTCYSGTGASDGYPLKFIFGIDLNSANYGSLRATTGVQIVVTLTLTAAQ